MKRYFCIPLAASTLVFAGLSPTFSQEAQDVTVRLSFTPFAAHIPVYVAQANGYYEEAGLNVTIEPGRGSTFAATTIGSGQEEFGLADAAAVVMARAQGLPVVAVANLQQDNGIALVATAASGITSPGELAGRNVGLFTGSTTAIFLEALLNKEGLTLEDINPISVRPGTDLPLVLAGEIDAEVNVYNNDIIAWGIEHPDLDITTWQLDELGFDTPGITLITNETMLETNPDLVRAFTSATLKGSEFAVENPEEAVQALVSQAPELDPEMEAAKWNAHISSVHSEATEEQGIGALDMAKWQTLVDLLETYGAIDTEVDLAVLLNGEYRISE